MKQIAFFGCFLTQETSEESNLLHTFYLDTRILLNIGLQW